MGFELFVEPVAVIAPQFQIVLQHPAVIDEDCREAGLLRCHLQILGRGGLLVGKGEDGDLPVGFQNGVFDRGNVGDPLHSQLFHQFVNCKAVFSHFQLVERSVFHDNGGPSADESPEFDALHGDDRDDHGEGEQGEDGDDARQKRNAEVLHGYSGQVCDDEGEHQLRGLQLSHLTLSHEADSGNDEQIEDDGTDEGNDHIATSPACSSVQYGRFPRKYERKTSGNFKTLRAGAW